MRGQLHRLEHGEPADREHAHDGGGEPRHACELRRRHVEARQAAKDEAGNADVQNQARNRDLVEVRPRARPGEPDERDDEDGGYDAEQLEDHAGQFPCQCTVPAPVPVASVSVSAGVSVRSVSASSPVRWGGPLGFKLTALFEGCHDELYGFVDAHLVEGDGDVRVFRGLEVRGVDVGAAFAA